MINATVEVEASTAVPGALAVDLIHLPHCAFIGWDANRTVLTAYAHAPDANVTAVVVVRYPQRTSFSGGGDDTRVFYLYDTQVALVPAALNASASGYSFDPSAEHPFASEMDALDGLADSVDWSYSVSGNLTLFPDFYPGVEGTFQVTESHRLVEDFTAAMEWQEHGYCD